MTVERAGKLVGRVALVMGAGQTPGTTIGNGRATAVLFAREGAKVVAADRSADAVGETVDQILAEGGEAVGVTADVTSESDIIAAVNECMSRYGRIDVLHNNVGVSIAGGDAPITEIDAEVFTRLVDINLRGMVLACKHVLPVMRAQRSGAVVNVSSIAAIVDYPYIGYRATKSAVNTMTELVAVQNAEYGIRANAIMPGLMDTPMAIENRVGKDGMSREDVIASRAERVPLGRHMGTAWDVAKAALFLASDDAGFITGVCLAVDGGQALVRG